MGGKARTLDDVQEMGLSGAVALVKEYAGADEKTGEFWWRPSSARRWISGRGGDLSPGWPEAGHRLPALLGRKKPAE